MKAGIERIDPHAGRWILAVADVIRARCRGVTVISSKTKEPSEQTQ
ncbi:hypothetical protein [Sorangium sp. So ce1097]